MAILPSTSAYIININGSLTTPTSKVTYKGQITDIRKILNTYIISLQRAARVTVVFDLLRK